MKSVDTILATLVYLTCDNKTLMIHRCKRSDDEHKGKYNGLGGKLEEGETPIECAKREFFEESGLVLDRLFYKGVLTFPAFDREMRNWIVFVYTAHSYSGVLKTESGEGRLEWIENQKILGLPLWEGDKYFLKYVFDDLLFEGKLYYQNGKLVQQKIIVLSDK